MFSTEYFIVMAGLDMSPEKGDPTEHLLLVAVPVGQWRRAFGDMHVAHMDHPPIDILEIAHRGMQTDSDLCEKDS